MTVYVDTPARYTGKGRLNGWWSHLATDGDIAELHAIAGVIGLKREWFQDHPAHPHYDVRPSLRALAVDAGALRVTPTDLVLRCSAVFRKGEPLAPVAGYANACVVICLQCAALLDDKGIEDFSLVTDADQECDWCSNELAPAGGSEAAQPMEGDHNARA